MLIDVSNVSTIPKEIENIIFGDFAKLSTEIVNKIKERKVQYNNDILYAIENYYAPLSASSEILYNELIQQMEKHDLILYHATKVMNKESILQNGLKANKWEAYKESFCNVLSELGIAEDIKTETIELVHHEYKRKYLEIGRESQLCFFSDMGQVDQDEGVGCEQFCENLGGELARWSLKDRHPMLYEPLRNNGEAYIVKFKMPFFNIAYFEKETILYQFVIHYAARYFFSVDCDIQFTGMTEYDVPKEDILGLIPYTKVVDY